MSTTDSIPKVRVVVPRHLEDTTKRISLRRKVFPYEGRRRPMPALPSPVPAPLPPSPVSWWRRALGAVKRSGRAS
jgi:hypothetical protein